MRLSTVARCAVVALGTFVWSAVIAPAAPVAAAPDAAALKILDDVRKTFTIEGKPVPPEIFRDLGDGDLADSGPIWVAVDLQAAIGSNLYADPIKVDGKWVSQTKPNDKTINGREETSYRMIGTTENKLLVLVTSYNGGGSGSFFTLHVVDVAANRAFAADGTFYERINMTDVRSIALGDRWDGDVTISGNQIVVRTKSSRPTADMTIRLEATRPEP